MTESLLTTKFSPETIAKLKRWISLHRVLWVLTIGCFFAAWNRGLALLYGMSSLLLALLLISYILPRLQLRGIEVKRLLKGVLTVGEHGKLIYRIRTPGKRYHIELCESLPFANKEDSSHLFFGRIDDYVESELKFNCEHRGCFLLDELKLTSAYPFGIIKYSKKVSTTPLELLVLPKVYELTQIPLPAVACSTTVGDLLVPQQGGRDEFASVREYSHGDELNRIHWAASARYQNLVVKEYDRTDKPTLLIALDCRPIFSIGEGKLNTFEYAITIAASVIHYASRQGIQSYLLAEDGHAREMVVPAYCSDLYELYELLARLNSTGTQSATDIINHAQQSIPQANLAMSFRIYGDSLMPKIAPHVSLIDMEMHGKSFLKTKQIEQRSQFQHSGTRFTYSVFGSTDIETLFQ